MMPQHNVGDTESPKNKDPPSLLESLLWNEETRTAALKQEARAQAEYPKSNSGWVSTILMVQGRALDNIALPWAIIMAHSVIYTILQEFVFHFHRTSLQSWEILFSIVLNSTLAFLLVFRQNRSASRFWEARLMWGLMVARGRAFVGGIIAHGGHDKVQRDHAIRWILASFLSTMCMLRGGKGVMPVEVFAGILTQDELQILHSQRHRPVYALDRARKHLNTLFYIDSSTPVALAVLWSGLLNSLERSVDVILESIGGLERVKGTPLPVAYVSHLRTFLLISLLLFPYVWGPLWRWNTIPIMALTAFAWLGIEGAASENELPFRRERVNALDMGSFCLGFQDVVIQQLQSEDDKGVEQNGSTRS